MPLQNAAVLPTTVLSQLQEMALNLQLTTYKCKLTLTTVGAGAEQHNLTYNLQLTPAGDGAQLRQAARALRHHGQRAHRRQPADQGAGLIKRLNY